MTLVFRSFRAVFPLLLAGALTLGGCSTPPERNDVYSASQVGRPMNIGIGEVLGLRAVRINPGSNGSGVGETAGAVIGGIVGSGVSDNARAAAVGAVLGALAGGTLGRTMEKQTATVPGWEITYRDMQTGRTQMVVQPMKGLETLRPGARIRIIRQQDGAIRISPL